MNYNEQNIAEYLTFLKLINEENNKVNNNKLNVILTSHVFKSYTVIPNLLT